MTADHDNAEAALPGHGRQDPEPEPASGGSPAPERPSRRSLAVFAALLVALNVLLLAVLGFVVREREQGMDQARQTLMVQLGAVRDRVSKLEAASSQTPAADTALQARVSALETALPKEAPAQAAGMAPEQMAALAELGKRIGVLEARPAPDTTALTALEQRVGGLETQRLVTAAETAARIDALEKDVRETVKPALSGLAQTMPQLATKAELQAVVNRLAGLEASDERPLVKAAASALAISVLSDAVRSGAPYAEELAAVGRLATAPLQGLPAFDTLGRQAAMGLPTQEQLVAAFPAAARAAREAETPRDTGMMSALKRTFGDLVSFRMPGASTETALDLMAKALHRDDLGQALVASQGLAPKARAALEPWLARARLRQSGLAAVTSLRASAIRSLAATATQ
jgi:hypothetical protein